MAVILWGSNPLSSTHLTCENRGFQKARPHTLSTLRLQ
jgi:hypothetical protein